MTDSPRDHALCFEAVKISVRQTKDGHALVLSVHEDDAPEELFRSKIGSRFQVAMVLIGDDGKPTSTVKPEVHPRDDRVQYAVMLCKEPMFQEWVAANHRYPSTEVGARTMILDACGIATRADLKHIKRAQDAFDALTADYRHDVGIEKKED